METARRRTASRSVRSNTHSRKSGITGSPRTRRVQSDSQDAKSGPAALQSQTKTAGGVDAYATKAHLLNVAKRLEVKGRSKMTKAQLVEAVDKANRGASALSLRKDRRRS